MTVEAERPRFRVPAVSKEIVAPRAEQPGRSAYVAASKSNRDIGLWRPPLRSADSEVLSDAAQVRARARSLVRDHPYAKQAVRISRLGVVGKQLRLDLRPDYRFLGIDRLEAKRWAREFVRVWEEYAHGPRCWIDAGRRLNFTQMMGLAHNLEFVEGEAFLSVEWRQGAKFKTCFQLVDNDRLANPFGKPDTVYLKGGVALDELNAPIGYHVRNAHPGDIGVLGADTVTWTYMPRETAWGRPVALHCFFAERAAQTRGISEFTTVIRAMRMGAEYAETALAAAVLQASYAAVLTSAQNYKEALEVISASADPSQDMPSLADLAGQHLAACEAFYGEQGVLFNGLKVPHLVPGDKLELLSPGQNATSLEEFEKSSTKKYAAGLGTDPISVSQNYSDVNYSSARMSVANNWRSYEERRARLISAVALPMVQAFMEEVLHERVLPMPKGLKDSDLYAALPALAKGVFITAGAPMLDPVKERQGQEIGLRIGVDTLQSIAAEDGEDWEELLDQKALERQAFLERGLTPPGEMPMTPPPASGDDDG